MNCPSQSLCPMPIAYTRLHSQLQHNLVTSRSPDLHLGEPPCPSLPQGRSVAGERKMGDTGTSGKTLQVLGQPEVLTAQHRVGIAAFIHSLTHARQIGLISANSSRQWQPGVLHSRGLCTALGSAGTRTSIMSLSLWEDTRTQAA